ncbi:MAG TPA: hypothetical protein VKB75_13275 [Jatrophihabitans sp.]|nr:hypothetical protein [Jatrophihabitans sp.]
MIEFLNRADRHVVYGGVAGVIGVAVPAVGLAIVPIWRFPATGASGAQIAAFTQQRHGALQAVMLFYTLGVTVWLVFGAALWAQLRHRAEVGSPIPTGFAAGLVGFVTVLLAGITAFDVLLYRQPGPVEARLLYDLTFGLLAMSGMPTAVALGAFAVGVYRHRWLPRHTADLAAVTAVAHVVLLLSFIAGSGFFSLEGAVITVIPALLWAWILITGISMIRCTPQVALATRAGAP